MKRLPLIIGVIFVLTIAIIIITTFQLEHKEASVGEFKTMVGAEFVGSIKCKQCHERKFLEWTTTLHSKMMQDAKANPMAIIGDFNSSSEVRTFKKEEVDFTLGNQWKQQYLKKAGDDYVVLPAQYNISSGQWVSYQAEDGQDQSWFKECAGCHATGVDPEKKTFKEPGIGCEACHGPGSNHVKAIPGYEIATIVNPQRLTTNAAAQICGSCHSRGMDKSGQYPYPVNYMTSRGVANLRIFFNHANQEENKEIFWPSGDSKHNYMQYLDWQKSEHAKAGVTCTNCHTIHVSRSAFQTKLQGDKLCRSCHQTMENRGAHKLHTFGSCIACHMPRTGKSAEAGDIRSHTFRFIPPEYSIEMGGLEEQPNSCSGCHHHKDDLIEGLVEFLDAVKRTDMPKPYAVHRREALK